MKAYLILENGTIFEGETFGAQADTAGELVFTTAMTGYLETLTDPSYYGQMVVQTFPLIGNYGVIPQDFESSRPSLKAYIVRQWCQEPSNFRSRGTLDAFLMQNNIPGICGIDTRALTRLIREQGVMNAKLIHDLHHDVIPFCKVTNAVPAVSCGNESLHPVKNAKYKVVLWDFGAKENILRELTERHCEVVRVPYHTSVQRIQEFEPDGVMLSNGPGDPAENTGCIREVGKLLETKVPAFGICLGHQLMALSRGAKTEKLKYGHRGANQPSRDIQTGRVYITSQNHGYTVSETPMGAKIRFVNANDGTVEGIDYLNTPAFSVQFHPEAAAGPLDTAFLFDRFIELMERGKQHAAQ